MYECSKDAYVFMCIRINACLMHAWVYICLYVYAMFLILLPSSVLSLTWPDIGYNYAHRQNTSSIKHRYRQQTPNTEYEHLQRASSTKYRHLQHASGTEMLSMSEEYHHATPRTPWSTTGTCTHMYIRTPNAPRTNTHHRAHIHKHTRTPTTSQDGRGRRQRR